MPPLPPASLMLTGANGRVGRLLTGAFSAQTFGAHGIGVVLAHRGREALHSDLPSLIWSPLDGAGPLERWAAKRGAPAALAVLAGVTPTSGADMDLNAELAEASIAAARAVGVGRVLLASSAAVYGRGRATPWREDEAVDPPSAYGRAKLAMEHTCGEPDARPGVCALRIGNVAGADALLSNRERPLLLDRFAGETGPVRSYIGPVTLARVLLGLATTGADLPPVLNVAAPQPVAMADLARAAGLPFVWRKAPEAAIERLVLDVSALASHIRLADTESQAATLVAQWRACQFS